MMFSEYINKKTKNHLNVKIQLKTVFNVRDYYKHIVKNFEHGIISFYKHMFIYCSKLINSETLAIFFI